MTRLREMTQAGDPMMKIRLPKALDQFIKDKARRSGRTHQDEVIKRIVAVRVSLKIEVASLLLASFVEKKALKMSPLVNHILNYKFPKRSVLRELRENRQGWQYRCSRNTEYV